MMRYAPYARPALAGLLLMLFAAEWLIPGPAAPGARLAPAIPTAVADAAADAAIGQWGDTALARPLFSPSRRPAAQAGTDTDGSLPRLSAIIITAGGKSAVFAADGQKPQVVAEGGEIGGYRLQSIAPDKVDMLGPDGAITLRPQFSTPAAATAAPAALPATNPALNPASNPALMIEQNF